MNVYMFVYACRDPIGSRGFCLLNNVAIAGAYARCRYRDTIKKVAIIDFDVHHGNGTEEIVR
jgi:acetoin utilization deacetylase AcuC-like enzyme